MNEALYNRLTAKTSVSESGCWVWTGVLHTSTKYPAGHHGMTMYKGKSISTHRAMWIAVHGSIPEGKHVCHTCDVPACINPEHLWIGTHRENMADMNRKGRNPMASKTHCKRGHPFSPENTYLQRSGATIRGRGCRACATLLRKQREVA